MKRIAEVWFRLAVIFVIIGMGIGLYMGKNEDFTIASAHAHNNLLGWVGMMLFGLFYKVYPAAGRTKLAAIHFWLYLVSVVVLIPSLIMQLSGQLAFVPLVIGSSAILALSMILFALVVFKATAKGSTD